MISKYALLLYSVQSIRARFRFVSICMRWGRWIATSILLILLSGCAEAPAITSPKSDVTRQIATLWWVMFGLGTFIVLVVMGYLFIALRRRRQEEEDKPDEAGFGVVAWGGAIIPGLIVIGLMAYTIYVLDRINHPDAPIELVVEVRSHQWWWRVIYPEYNIETANEIRIPAGKPVQVRLSSGDVIHSFWVPELQGKTDMEPGTWTETWLEATEPGQYRGLCAEFCGLQHARMQFLVIAMEQEEFENWLEQQQALPEADTGPVQLGEQVFMSSDCVYCHTIRGTDATGTLGPDLTKLSSRVELGAGTLPNTRGHLAAWILDAQVFKPGIQMPAVPMNSEDLQAMLVYLENLQ